MGTGVGDELCSGSWRNRLHRERDRSWSASCQRPLAGTFGCLPLISAFRLGARRLRASAGPPRRPVLAGPDLLGGEAGRRHQEDDLRHPFWAADALMVMRRSRMESMGCLSPQLTTT